MKNYFSCQLEHPKWAKSLADAKGRCLDTDMTRREGTSWSNSLCASGFLTSKGGWTATTKVSIVRDPMGENQWNPHNFESCLIANNLGVTRGHGKFVLSKSNAVQGPAWSAKIAEFHEKIDFSGQLEAPKLAKSLADAKKGAAWKLVWLTNRHSNSNVTRREGTS